MENKDISTAINEFISDAKKKGHKLLKLNYYKKDVLCTVIVADYTDEIVRFINFTDFPLYTAFGIRKKATWDDYNYFLEDRCIPKSRMGLRYYLEAIGVDEYNPIEIIKKSEGRMAEDDQWLEVEEL